MFNSLANMRWPILAAALLGLLCSFLIAAEFDLVFVSDPVASGGRSEKFELEELLTLSGAFSVLLAILAFVVGKTAIGERRRRALIEVVAYFDPLTGLPNRRVFDERLASALAWTGAGPGCALLLIDLDHFKQVNDQLGHAAGDRLLVEVGERLRAFAAVPEDAARLGGDEFALILRGDAATEPGARTLILELHEAIRRPFTYKGKLITPAASIGVAFAGEEARRSSDLLEEADSDMYRNKQRGRERLVA